MVGETHFTMKEALSNHHARSTSEAREMTMYKGLERVQGCHP
jgi:hypothetical protein